MKYELVEKSDDIVFCHRLFQEVFAYQHALTETQTMGLNCISYALTKNLVES